AERLEHLARKQLVRALGLLQAQDVRLGFLEQAAHEVDAQPHRVDVPGDQSQRNSTFLTLTKYERRVGCSSADDKPSKGSQMPRAEFWGQNKTAPGRGGGPGACLSEALGGIRARRGNGAGFKRACHPLRFWKR